MVAGGGACSEAGGSPVQTVAKCVPLLRSPSRWAGPEHSVGAGGGRVELGDPAGCSLVLSSVLLGCLQWGPLCPSLCSWVSPPPPGRINVKNEELEAMVKEAPGPINFTVFLTMFGEKLKGERGPGGLWGEAGQPGSVCRQLGAWCSPSCRPPGPHPTLHLYTRVGVGPPGAGRGQFG